MLLKNILILNIFLPIFGVIILLFLPIKEIRAIKLTALHLSSLTFLGFLFLWICFNKSTAKFQFVSKFILISLFNLNFSVGIDGISLFFILLSTFLIPLCILSSWESINQFIKEFLIIFLVLDFLLINVFCSMDLLFFYVFFETILIPMFLLIGIWGSRDRKILAAYYFFLYTLLGSIIMLLAIIYILDQIGSTDYEILLIFTFSKLEQKFLWFCFFLSFSSKVPMFPVHLWLPEAHVEAPTAGSVILAGVLLKLGTYGFIRFCIPIFPIASIFFTPLIYSLVVVAIIYSSFTAIRQTDLKRIVAYTSISHMNLVLLGIFSFNIIGLEGAIFQSLNHGFTASALFLLIGVVYDRYKTRIVQYYSGLFTVMPLFAIIFLFFSLANIGFPGTGNFIGELLIFMGSFKINFLLTFFSATGLILSAAYGLWLYNRMVYGNLKLQYTQIFIDLKFRELVTFIPLIIGSFIPGVYSGLFLIPIHYSTNYLIETLFF